MPTPTQQRELVDAFLATSRDGDFEGLVAVLDPDAVFRIDAGGAGPRARELVVGAEAVARQVLACGSRSREVARQPVPASSHRRRFYADSVQIGRVAASDL
jgi:ketosteroid isomerase-like protein